MVNIGFFNASLIFYVLGTAMYLAYLAHQREYVEKAAYLFTVIGFALQTIFLTVRGVEGGHHPISNTFESLNFFAWAIILSMILMGVRSCGVICPGVFSHTSTSSRFPIHRQHRLFTWMAHRLSVSCSSTWTVTVCVAGILCWSLREPYTKSG